MTQLWPPKLSDVGRFTLLAVVVFALNGSNIGETAAFLTLFVGVVAVYEILERYTESRRIAVLVVSGLAAAVSAGGVVALPGSTLVYGGLCVVALWLFADTYTTAESDRGRADAPASTTDDRLQAAVLYGIRDELGDAEEPRTAAAVADALDVSPARVESGMETLVADGLVFEAESGYVLDEDEVGAVPMARHLTTRVVWRLLRPVRLLRERQRA